VRRQGCVTRLRKNPIRSPLFIIPAIAKHIPILPLRREWALYDWANARAIAANLGRYSLVTDSLMARVVYARAEANWEVAQPGATETFNACNLRWANRLLGCAPADRTEDASARFAIATAQMAVRFNDDAFLEFAQDRVFGLGTGWRTRARLADYLYPYPIYRETSPEGRLEHILGADNPGLFVKQCVRDLFSVRHGEKRQTANHQPLEQASREAIDDLLAECHFETSYRFRLRVQWEQIADLMASEGDKQGVRTARELRQILDGATIAEMGEKNYRHFRNSLHRIGGIAYKMQICPPSRPDFQLRGQARHGHERDTAKVRGYLSDDLSLNS
jgi:hypothetical protein